MVVQSVSEGGSPAFYEKLQPDFLPITSLAAIAHMPLRTRRASTLISPASLMLCDDDAVLLSRLPEVTAISDDDLLHLVVSLERKAQRSAQGLPCLVSKAAAKAASKSASEATELGWRTSTATLWLTAFMDSLTEDQLLQEAITAMVQEVHRRAQV